MKANILKHNFYEYNCLSFINPKICYKLDSEICPITNRLTPQQYFTYI